MIIFDLFLTKGVDYNNTDITDEKQRELYTIVEDKFVVGETYKYTCYWGEGETDCTYIEAEAYLEDVDRVAIGGGYGSSFVKQSAWQKAWGTIAFQCADNDYCRIVLEDDKPEPEPSPESDKSLIKEYWDKNYPSINWNILPQLFEEEKTELTKEIEEYLKTTPWNMNHAILKTLLEGKYENSEKGSTDR